MPLFWLTVKERSNVYFKIGRKQTSWPLALNSSPALPLAERDFWARFFEWPILIHAKDKQKTVNDKLTISRTECKVQKYSFLNSLHSLLTEFLLTTIQIDLLDVTCSSSAALCHRYGNLQLNSFLRTNTVLYSDLIVIIARLWFCIVYH